MGLNEIKTISKWFLEGFNILIDQFKKMECCGNCKYLCNKYFSGFTLPFSEDFQRCYPKQNFKPTCNTVICEKGHYPKHVDNVCDDWVYDEQTKEQRKID